MLLQENKAVVEEIIKSKSFGNSTTYANLFRYLVECTISNEIPKETTIAAEIFGKKNFDPSQSTLIRVYVYNLRKKLDTYYQSEGVDYKERIQIPKGSYAVQIVESQEMNNEHNRFFEKKWLIPLLGILLSSLALNIYFGATNQNKALVKRNGLWADLIKSEFPKMLVLGNLFVYSERDTTSSLTRTIRGPNINTIQEFESFRSKNEKSHIEIEPLTYTHLILGSTHWIKNLSEIFYSIDRDYTIRTMSRFNPKQLQEYDIIVVGMQKTLGVFRTIHKNSMFEYDIEKDAFSYQTSTEKEPKIYQPTGNADSYHTDYGLMAKIPGANNNTIYLFSGLWDTGATQSLKNFTDVKLLTEMEAQLKLKFGSLPKYYEVFFEVNGIDRMELSSKILYLNKLDETSH